MEEEQKQTQLSLAASNAIQPNEDLIQRSPVANSNLSFLFETQVTPPNTAVQAIDRIEPSGYSQGTQEGFTGFDETDEREQRVLGADFGDSFNAAAREVIPGLRQVQDGTDFFHDYEADPEFRKTQFEGASQIYAEMGVDNFDDLDEAESMEELVAIRDEIKNAEVDLQYMSENHSFAGSMGLYALAGTLDPTSWLGYGLVYKGIKMAKIAERVANMSTKGKMAFHGGVASAYEGASDYYIQSHGSRHYESVPITMAFAFTIAGGGTGAVNLLQSKHAARQQGAYDKLYNSKFKIQPTQKEKQEFLNEMYVYDMLQPYRSKIAKVVSKITSNSITKRLFHSPTYLAYERGGFLSAMAHRVDTLPGLSAESGARFGVDDALIYKAALPDGKTAMDIKYEAMEHYGMLEYARATSYKKYQTEALKQGSKPMTKQEFSELVYTNIANHYYDYRGKKLVRMDEIKADQKLMEDIYTVVDNKLLDDRFYKDLGKDKVMTAKELLDAQIEYRNAKIDGEVDNLAKERMKSEPEFEIKTSVGPIRDTMEASSKYYADMQQLLKRSGVPWADVMDPRFYQPIMYNKNAIIEDTKFAEDTVANAIRKSADYQHQVAKAVDNLHSLLKAKSGDTSIAEAKVKLQEAENKLVAIEVIELEVKRIVDDEMIPPRRKAQMLAARATLAKEISDNTSRILTNRIGEIYAITKRGDKFFFQKYNEIDGTLEMKSQQEFEADTINGVKGVSREDVNKVINSESEAARSKSSDEILDKIHEIIDGSDSIKAIMDLTGITKEDFHVGNDNMNAHWNPTNSRIAIAKGTATEQTIIHELIHGLTTEGLDVNPAFKAKMIGIRDHIFNNRAELEKILKDSGVDIHKSYDDPHIQYDGHGHRSWKNSSDVNERIEYMLGIDDAGKMSDRQLGELTSVALSNTDIARALNKMKMTGANGKKISVLKALLKALKEFIGIGRVKKDSVFGQLIQGIEENMANPTRKQVGKTEWQIRDKYRQIENDIAKLEGQLTIEERTQIYKDSIIEKQAGAVFAIEQAESHSVIVDTYKNIILKDHMTVQRMNDLIDEMNKLPQSEELDDLISTLELFHRRGKELSSYNLNVLISSLERSDVGFEHVAAGLSKDEAITMRAAHNDMKPYFEKGLGTPSARITKAAKSKQLTKLYDDAAKELTALKTLKEKQRKSASRSVMKAEKGIDNAEAKLKELDPKILAANKEVNKINKYPEQAAKGMVNKLKDQTLLRQFGFDEGVTPRLKGRTLNLNTSAKGMEKIMYKNEAQVSQAYQYAMSGKAATNHAFGTHNAKDFRNQLESRGDLSKEDMQIGTDMFELTLGTRQMAADPDSFWEKGVRNISSFNYATMGGQFAKYGLSEIGAGVYATNFNYFKTLMPAINEVISMYKTGKLDDVAIDSMSMAEASEIFSRNSTGKYGDYDFIESTFSEKFETGMKGVSNTMFRYSGLEGISAITKIALPRAFLRRIIDAANNGKHAYDLTRWGISAEDMVNIKQQPWKMNDNGVVTDFNFKAWDKDLAEKFWLASSRMSRDGIMRPDAVRIPAWMNNGGSNPIFKLAKQFMSFAAMANERLMLRGLSERRRMALVGASISGVTLGLFEHATEQLAIGLGIIKEENAKYDLDTEKGLYNLMTLVATRSSFVGGPNFMFEQANTFAQPWGSTSTLSQIGGPTGGRLSSMAQAAKELGWDGKLGTSAQVHSMKTMVPFNNLIGLDSFGREIIKDMHTEAKKNDFNRMDAGKEFFKTDKKEKYYGQ